MKRSRIYLVLALGVLTAALFGTASAATQAAPTNTAPPTVTGTASVGQTLTAENGTWANSPDRVPVPVAPLWSDRRELRRRPRRDPEDVPRRGGRPRAHAPRPGHCRERRRRGQRALGPDGCRRAEQRCASEPDPPDDHRRHDGRPGADRRFRHVDEHPHVVRLSVAALRSRRQRLLRRRRRDRQDVRRP